MSGEVHSIEVVDVVLAVEHPLGRNVRKITTTIATASNINTTTTNTTTSTTTHHLTHNY